MKRENLELKLNVEFKVELKLESKVESKLGVGTIDWRVSGIGHLRGSL